MKAKKHKAKKGAWYVRVRRSYLPASWQGVLLHLLYAIYLAALLLTWYKNGHDMWHFLVFVVPLSVAAALAMQYIASKNS